MSRSHHFFASCLLGAVCLLLFVATGVSVGATVGSHLSGGQFVAGSPAGPPAAALHLREEPSIGSGAALLRPSPALELASHLAASAPSSERRRELSARGRSHPCCQRDRDGCCCAHFAK